MLISQYQQMDPKKAFAIIIFLVYVSAIVGLVVPSEELLSLKDAGKSKKSASIENTKNETLSEYMWRNVEDLVVQARKTIFISGVRNGDLHPNFYGNYTLQDAAWCREVAQLWNQLSNNTNAPEELRSYAIESYKSYQNYAMQFFASWNIKDEGALKYGIILQDAARNYVETIRNATVKQPTDIMIATFACVKLWANLTEDMWSSMTTMKNLQANQINCPNLYKFWVEENRGNASAIKHAMKIDEFDNDNWYDWNKALSLFRKVMNCEINFFNLTQGASLKEGANLCLA